MRIKYIYLLMVFVLLPVIGCNQQTEDVDIEIIEESIEMDFEATGSLQGSVLYSGEVPERVELPYKGNPECVAEAHDTILSEELLVKDGKLQNAFVYIKEGLEDYEFPAPKTPVDIYNKGCIYLPHVVGAQVDQPIKLINNDATFHNIHSFAKNQKGWNIGLPFQGMKQIKKFSEPEVAVKLKCDLHPWMIGYVGIVSHPYFFVTGEDGSFSMDNVPVGDYVLEVWHEKLGTKTIEVSIGAGSNQNVELNY